MRVSALMKSSCQGQRAGRCSVHWRRGAGQSAGDREQPAAEGAGGADVVVRAGRSGLVQRSRLCASAAITVQAALALKLPGGEVRERLVFEVADRELDDGVLAVLGLDERERLGAVGDEREVPPVGQQLGLRLRACGCAGRSAAAAPSVVSAICGLAVVGVVGERLPGARRIARSRRDPGLCRRTPIE